MKLLDAPPSAPLPSRGNLDSDGRLAGEAAIKTSLQWIGGFWKTATIKGLRKSPRGTCPFRSIAGLRATTPSTPSPEPYRERASNLAW